MHCWLEIADREHGVDRSGRRYFAMSAQNCAKRVPGSSSASGPLTVTCRVLGICARTFDNCR